jgi:hypothetical protein
MTEKAAPEFLALERAIAPFAEGFQVRSENDGVLAGVYLYRTPENGRKPEIGVFAGLLLDATAYPHFARAQPPEAIVMAYVRPVRSPVRRALLEGEEAIFRTAHETLLPIASPEPFEIFPREVGALARRRRLPEGAANLTDRRMLEFCRGSLALLGQAGLLDALRQYDFVAAGPK